jgi:CBS domain-containing protein
MELKNILTKDVITIGLAATALDAAKLMARKNISSILVIDEKGTIAGIISERDFLHLVKNERDPTKIKAQEMMSSPVITADTNTSLEGALKLMHDKGIRRIPITEDGRLAGIITETDLANAMRTSQLDVELTVEEHIVSSPMKHNLQFGKTYLYLETKPDMSVQAFVDMVKHGTAGLMVTRQKPEHLMEEWALEKTPIVWLTNACPQGNYIDPHDVQGVSILIGNYLSKACNSVIMLDGISYLITQNKFDTVLNLLQNMRDKAMKTDSTLILTMNPQTLHKQELELIKQEADEIL